LNKQIVAPFVHTIIGHWFRRTSIAKRRGATAHRCSKSWTLFNSIDVTMQQSTNYRVENGNLSLIPLPWQPEMFRPTLNRTMIYQNDIVVVVRQRRRPIAGGCTG